MLLPGTYKGRIKDWGVKWFKEKDEYKAFITFEIEGTDEQTIWMSSLDKTEKTGKTGKPYNFYSMTMRTLQSAGFKGDDIGLLVTKTDALEMGKLFSVTLTKSFGQNGKEYLNTSFEPLNADGTVTAKSGPGTDLEGDMGAAQLRAKLGIPSPTETDQKKKAINDAIDMF